MKIFTRVISVILAVTLMFSVFSITAFAAEDSSCPVSANSGTIGDCTWSVENKVLTISGNGTTGDMPASFAAPPWGKDISLVIVEEGVTSLGNYLFYTTNSNEYFFPESVTSFGDSLLGLALLNKNKTIYAPGGSAAETYANDNGIKFQVSCGTTGDCTWSLLGTTLTISGNGAMPGCEYAGYDKYILPWGDKITKVIIGEGVTAVGLACFYKCGSLKEVILPESLETVGTAAFYECKKLETVNFGGSLKTIEYRAFYDCTALKNLDFPESLTKIENEAFYECTSLKALTIPANTAKLGSSAFRGCRNIDDLYVYNKTCNLGSAFQYTSLDGMTVYGYINSTAQSFANNNNLTFVQLAEFSRTGECYYELDGTKLRIFGSGRMGSYTYSSPAPWGKNITSVTIENGVKNVGSYAFNGCKQITEITLPESVTQLGEYAFMYCENLASVNIPDGVNVITKGVFDGCKALDGVELHEGITAIESFAFSLCDSLSSITLPESLETIGDQAFYGCDSLSEFEVPKNVTNIGYNILGGENNLSSITVNPGNTVYDSRENCNAVIETETNILLRGCKNTVIPASVTAIGQSAFDWCTGLKRVEIPGTVRIVGFNAFNYSGVNEVVIDEGVEKLDTQAFSLCLSLKKITIPASVTDISSTAFNGTKNFTIYGYEGSYAQQYARMNEIPFEHILKTGDVNGDNNIDVLDAIAAQKYAVEKAILNAEQLYAADVNGDGIVDVLDAIDIQKYASEKITGFKKNA